MFGHKLNFGTLEQAVMDVVWDRGSVTVRDVVDAVNHRRAVAYTTVMTVMNRLVEQDCLKRRRAVRGAFIYQAAHSREATAAAAARHSLQSLIRQYGEVGLVQFLDQLDRIPESRLQRLRRQLRRGKRS